jgi:hypothetical protein
MGTFGGGLAVGMSMVQPSGGGGAAIPDVTVATSQTSRPRDPTATSSPSPPKAAYLPTP